MLVILLATVPIKCIL